MGAMSLAKVTSPVEPADWALGRVAPARPTHATTIDAIRRCARMAKTYSSDHEQSTKTAGLKASPTDVARPFESDVGRPFRAAVVHVSPHGPEA
jgi:hypothetical protein